MTEETEDRESAEAKLAETEIRLEVNRASVYALEARILQLVGALERLGGSVAFVMPHVIAKGATGDELKARTEFARAALSGDDVEKYRELTEKLNGLTLAFNEAWPPVDERIVNELVVCWEAICKYNKNGPTTKEGE